MFVTCCHGYDYYCVLILGRGNHNTDVSGPMYSTSFMYQLYILSDRAFKNVIRNPLASVGNV